MAALLGARWAFGKKVWAELEPQWVRVAAGAVDQRVTIWFSRCGKRYSNDLNYKHRTLDIKGFSTQGKFALEMERVYVNLTVDPAVASDISQHPLGQRGSTGHDLFSGSRALRMSPATSPSPARLAAARPLS